MIPTTVHSMSPPLSECTCHSIPAVSPAVRFGGREAERTSTVCLHCCSIEPLTVLHHVPCTDGAATAMCGHPMVPPAEGETASSSARASTMATTADNPAALVVKMVQWRHIKTGKRVVYLKLFKLEHLTLGHGKFFPNPILHVGTICLVRYVLPPLCGVSPMVCGVSSGYLIRRLEKSCHCLRSKSGTW